MEAPRWPWTSAIALVLCLCLVGGASGQTDLSVQKDVSAEIQQKLSKRFSLDLRDATLLEALFAVRDVSGLNIVVGNEVTGTVNASFADTAVYDILDSLLITRGYGYRVVGGSLAIVPLASLGDQLPLFETKVIGLVHCTPTDVLSSIESMLSPEGRAHGVESSNSIVVIDYPERIDTVRRHLESLESAAQRYRQEQRSASVQQRSIGGEPASPDSDIVRVIQTQYVSSDILAAAIKPLLSEGGQAAAVVMENKVVVADKASNVQRIALALAELDQPRPQVRIWALIYDCSTDDLERLGVNWSGGLNSASIATATGSAAQSIAVRSITAPLDSGTNGVVTLTSLNRYMNMDSIIQALDTADDSRLLADPNVVVMNHEKAEIQIVTEVPYQQLTQGLEGGTIGTTEFREAGVTLNVVPHIAEDDTIALVVNPRFSLLTGFSEPDNAPIIDRRETTTTVRVANNQTIVLGGLRQRTRISERSAIPGLGRIPYLGKLFRHRSASTRESELLVFITPQIILDQSIGTAREHCVNQILEGQINQTPTDPVPFGIDPLRAELDARAKQIDHFKRLEQAHARQPHVHQPQSSTNACECFEIPWDQAFDNQAEPIDIGLSDPVGP
ncbi:Putative type II secretion system protein D precursor [Stieleria neptunia]|uniref:Type II secretion system protein D n=1 Tax=Stieleria neptunia TaxID=2527979 RepID=A0A518HTU2_9BACT|nr:type II secretion system protein GspD [Stieleria neptunia]QDV44234.1 Putative type II secretion system protein D precursor [Stieleria neptunia]